MPDLWRPGTAARVVRLAGLQPPNRRRVGVMSTRRSECSPIHHAGYLVCPICGAPGYATEATWLDGNHIIATFTPTCDHGPSETRVVSDGHAHMEAES